MFLITFSTFNSHQMQAIDPKTIGSEALSAIGSFGTYYAIKKAAIYCHELGHALTAQYLLNADTQIKVSPYPFGGGSTKVLKYGKKFDTLSKKSIKKRFVAICLAGPLAGMAACCLGLIATNIFSEYKNDATFLEACTNGLSKPLLNEDQNGIMQISLVSSAIEHFLNLVHFSDKNSDGSKILSSLEIPNPADSYPKTYGGLIETVGIATFLSYFNWRENNEPLIKLKSGLNTIFKTNSSV